VDVVVTQDRAVSGDLSFDAWASARVAGLLRFAYLVTGSQHAAEDAVQEALTSACARWARVSRTRDPETYVRRMVVNAHISGWRRTRRESPVAEVRETTYADPAGRIDTGDAVWRVCEALPRQQRAAVVLRFYEDLDYPEIAEILGVAEPTVRSHVHRALAALRTELTQPDEGDER
jgi:RNA polymerase sigma-70 factor (sigma-E family)